MKVIPQKITASVPEPGTFLEIEVTATFRANMRIDSVPVEAMPDAMIATFMAQLQSSARDAFHGSVKRAVATTLVGLRTTDDGRVDSAPVDSRVKSKKRGKAK